MNREIKVEVVDGRYMEVGDQEAMEINALMLERNRLFPEIVANEPEFEVPFDIMLRYSVAYQREVMNKRNMNPEFVRKLPLIKQKLYADGVTKMYAHLPQYRKRLEYSQAPLDQIGACSIGNMAYITKYDERYIAFLDELRTLPNIQGIKRNIP